MMLRTLLPLLGIIQLIKCDTGFASGLVANDSPESGNYEPFHVERGTATPIHALEDRNGSHIQITTFYRESWIHPSTMARISFVNSTHDQDNIPLSIGWGAKKSGLRITSKVNGTWLNGNDTQKDNALEPYPSDSEPSDGGRIAKFITGFDLEEVAYNENNGYRKIRFRVIYHRGNSTDPSYYWIRFHVGEEDEGYFGLIDYAYYVPEEVEKAGIRSRGIYFDCGVFGPLSAEPQAGYLDTPTS
ncbi:hypothetical protein TWF694_007334 [Orbilia ellipsospora]|uniref:Uncharacterized protein n=1 Tax=Orbilia ellipsospora TaxID=2528407 RepID=A0AAV9XIV3_9PEZI